MNDNMAVSFAGKDLQEVVVKVVNFLNSIKGINLANGPEEAADEVSEKRQKKDS